MPLPETDFQIEGLPFAPRSCVDLNAEVGRLGGADQVVQKADGGARFIGIPGHDKYTLQVSASDQWRGPPMDETRRGDVFTVHWPFRFRRPLLAGATSLTLAYPPAAGSVKLLIEGPPPALINGGWTLDGRTITLAIVMPVVVHVQYRPVMSMMLRDWTGSAREYAAREGWSLDFVEV